MEPVVMEESNKKSPGLLQIIVIICIVILAVRVGFLGEKVVDLKREFVDVVAIQQEAFTKRIVTSNETIGKELVDLRNFTIQQHNATLQLIRLNREAIEIVNSKIPDPNLLPKLAKQLTPSVVKIEVYLGIDEWTGEEMSWSGSGVFVAPDLILTAGHVVDRVMIKQEADPEYLWKVGPPITVKLVNGKELKVLDVYQADPNLTDLGLIRVSIPNDVNTPASLKFGEVEVGEQVFAIGEPYGLFPTVTSGIISALNVDNKDDFWGEANLLQTDCPLNPGNSGCPLLNMKGEIVGICVGGVGEVRQSSGIGFCVPAEICKQVIIVYNAECAFKRECEK